MFNSKIGESSYKIIANGYDESDYNKVEKENSEKFTIAYTGVLTFDQIPYSFVNALARFKREKILNFRIVMAGRNCREFDDLIEEKGLTNFVEKNGYVFHKKATSILESSDVLLLSINNIPRNKGILTGKIFEYFGCKKPIFAVGPLDGNANDLLKETKSGRMVSYDDDEGAYQLLRTMYDDWLYGNDPYEYNSERFSRKNLTKELSQLFNEAIG